MSLFLHIATALGLALAAGIRPFLPALAAGALARSDVFFDFHGTPYAFLQSGEFLLVVACLFVALAILRRRGLLDLVATGGVGLGGLLFAGVLAAHHDLAWPGLIAGAACALLAQFASRPVLEGASARLQDNAARYAVTLYADAAALVLALLAWFAPPVSLLALAFFASLLWAQRRRALGRPALRVSR
ncbi:MAG TPA: DUF4126 family protein [Solirubrobacteraceae bacterium]|jgi:hypothetical protein